MKKVIGAIGCVVGGGMIGFFAGRLNTVVGAVCFSLGVVLLVSSTLLFAGKDKDEK